MIRINLLPEKYKKGYKIEKTRRFFVFLFLSLYFVIFVFTILLFGSYYFLKTESDFWSENLELKKSDENIKSILELEKDIKKTNKKINFVYKINSNKIVVSDLIENISSLISDGVYLKSLSLNANTGDVNLSGFANTRDNILTLEDRLKNSNWVDKSSFVSPKSNILKKKNIDFTFSFKLKTNDIRSKK